MVRSLEGTCLLEPAFVQRVVDVKSKLDFKDLALMNAPVNFIFNFEIDFCFVCQYIQ